MRANSSAGPLARGLSIPSFSHAPRRSCKIEDTLTACHPTHSSSSSTAPAPCLGSTRILGYLGPPSRSRATAKQAILRAKGRCRPAAPLELERSLAEPTRREWEPLAAARRRGRRVRPRWNWPVSVPAERAGRSARVSWSAAEDGASMRSSQLQTLGTAADRLDRNGRPDAGCASSSRLPIATAARLPRGLRRQSPADGHVPATS